jgi:type IV pilus assembly protein PilM
VGLSRYGYEIVNLGLCPTPEGSVADGAVVDPDAVGAALKDLLRSRNIIQRQVMAALGGQGIILRHVQFPRMDLDELREVIRWEAEHHIPIPPPEAVVDFTVIPGQGETDEQGTQQMRVMLVGAQRAVVEAYVSALKKARLVPRGLDIEALADYRVLNVPAYRSQDPTRYAEAVIDLGHSATKLSIYLRGVLELTRTLATGGRAFTEALSGGLGVPQVEAERLKRRYGVRADGGRVLQTLSPTLNDLVFEIRRTFEFFASRHFGQSVRRVYLVGGGARMPGVAEALTRYLTPALGERVPEGADVRVEVVDPLAAIPLSPRLARQAPFIGPEFVTALGLALSVEEEAYEG